MAVRLSLSHLFVLCALGAPLCVVGNAPAQPTPIKPVSTDKPIQTVNPLGPQLVPASRFPLMVGVGIGDITGPAAEVGMMGYGKSDQITSGIQTRLWARAYVIANPSTGKRVVFVSAELGQLFSSIKQGVVKALKQSFGTMYDDTNVQIAATHTHSGPGGYSHHLMYNFTSNGFVRQNYDAIVSGITRAIMNAHGHMSPGSITVAQGALTDASVQRARAAQLLDNEFRGASPPPDVNQTMTVLRLNRATAAPVGAITWFSIHNASVSRFNTLISSDNKGHASLLFEKSKGTVMPFVLPGSFVAAFPNGDEGDISPNIGPNFTPPGGRSDFDSAAFTGEKQFSRAEQLFNGATEDLGAEIDYRHSFVSMPGFAVTSPTVVNGAAVKNGAGNNLLCNAAYGMSFAAGAKDGPTGMGPFSEGMKAGVGNANALEIARRWAVATLGGPLIGRATDGAWNEACQLPKPILVPSGLLNATPSILPFQILRIGSLAILGVPGEMTSVAGRRLTTKVQSILAAKGITRVIITGLANEYSGYITTPEEYDAQLYEGASTLFGRLTFDAYAQIFQDLARSMVSGQPSTPGPAPIDLLAVQASLQTGVVADTVKAGETMGQVIQDPPATNPSNGEIWIHARFRSGHPKNDLRQNDSYFYVEKKNGAAWERVAWDAMPETRFTWFRDRDGGPASSLSFVQISWMPPVGTAGTYRIKHLGAWKRAALDTNVTSYEGVSREFEVRPEAAVCKTLRAQEKPLVDRIADLNRQKNNVTASQKSCQAGTGDYAGQGGGKPRQCVSADDLSALRQLDAQIQSVTAQLTPIRNQKTAAACAY